MALKGAADKAGKPIYLEMSSINPVIILPGALVERGTKVAEEFAGSCLLGGRAVLHESWACDLTCRGTDRRRSSAKSKDSSKTHRRPLCSPPLSPNRCAKAFMCCESAGAEVITEKTDELEGARHPNTLLRTSGEQFLAQSQKLQTEAFGAVALFVVARDVARRPGSGSSRWQSHRQHLLGYRRDG